MDAIAIADANKIRTAMGLPPLPVPGENTTVSFKKGSGPDEEEDTISTLERRSAAAGSNWAKLEAERHERVERQKRKDAAKKARDAAARFTKLAGKGLGDLDGDEEGEDTRSWLLGQKKRQKKIEKTRKLEEERLAKEKAAQQEYGAKDLKGLKVAHEVDGFGDGEQILTLKDAEIGEDGESDEDELENADLAEKEKLDERLNRKKKRPVYDPNEVNESGEKTILGQYDEELGSKKRKRFTLNDRGETEKKAETNEFGAGTGKGIKISLDALMDDTPVNDYADPSSAKVRKPKKAKKERKTRRKELEEDDIPSVDHLQQNGYDNMEVDGVALNTTNATSRNLDIELDDEDLQSQLATQRRAALKKRKKMDAAELARQIREASDPPAQEEHDGSDGEPGLVIDETREFVSHLQRADSDSEADDADAQRRRHSSPGVKRESPQPDSDADIPMDNATEDFKRESRSTSPASNVKPTTSTGLDEEETTSSLGSVAAMLRKRGLISSTATSEGSAQAAHDRRYAEFLAANRTMIAEFDARARAEREADRSSGALSNLTAANRQEYARRENEKREAYLAQLQARHFSANYRPDVKLSYTDEHGRQLGQKDAFKHLSHMFHGKGSGKGKLEKRLKKIDDEKRRESRALLDQADGRGMGGVMREQEKRRGQAGVRLQ